MVSTTLSWQDQRLKQICQWQNARRFDDFIDEGAIHQTLMENGHPSRQAVRDIIQKARDHATTGELLAKHATVKNFCIANGILSFEEYLEDYASPPVRQIGQQTIIPRYLRWLEQNVPPLAGKVRAYLSRVREEQQRDLHF